MVWCISEQIQIVLGLTVVLNCLLVESEVAGIMEIDWNQWFLLLNKKKKGFCISTLSRSSVFVSIDLSVLR